MKKRFIILVVLVLQLSLLSYLAVQAFQIPLPSFSSFWPASQQQEKKVKPSLSVVLTSPVGTLSPWNGEEQTRVVLKNIYEPLVDFDQSLRIRPVLATSWGELSPTEWEFRLRDGVVFHNGKTMDADDVLFSFKKLSEKGNSAARPLLDTVDTLTRTPEGKIRIVTKKPDPLLLSKLRSFFIIPNNSELDTPRPLPGSGAYILSDQQDNDLVLDRYEQYYKKENVAYSQLHFVVSANKFARLEMTKNKKADIVSGLPEELIVSAQENGYKTVTVPTLESVFLLFNFKGPLNNGDIRGTIYRGINRPDLQNYLGLAGKINSQFASSGVFGFQPELIPAVKNIEAPVPLGQKLFLTMKLSKTNESLGLYLVDVLDQINIKVDAVTEEDAQLLQDIKNGNGDLFLLGWKFSDGDVSDFYESLIHTSSGQDNSYNGLGYSFPEVDQLIEQAASELDLKKRLKLLQQIMEKITIEHQIGVSLFEYNTTYAFGSDTSFTPSLDGTFTYQNLE